VSTKTKRTLIGISFLILFVLYTLALDPDTNLLNNLSFGAGLLLSLQILLMFAVGLAAVEIVTDFFTDRYFKLFDEKEIQFLIKKDPKALAIYMLGWSLRILGYSIMFGLIVISYIGNQ
jgi:hypothetical protein